MASSNKKEAENVKKRIQKAGLFFKKLPNRTFITEEVKGLPGNNPMKDRLTLLMCGNASGDFKVKPPSVYKKE